MYASEAVKRGFSVIFAVVSDPVDPLCAIALKVGLEPEQIQERLNEILEKSPIHFDINGEIRNISFSYGIVAFEEKKGKIADLVKEADQRMYQCKSRNHERISKRGAAE